MGDEQEKVIKLRDTASTRRALSQVNVGTALSGADGHDGGAGGLSDTDTSQRFVPGGSHGNADESDADVFTDHESDADADDTHSGMDNRDVDNERTGNDTNGKAGAVGGTETSDTNEFDHFKSAGTEIVAALAPFARSVDGRSVCDCLASIADSLSIIAANRGHGHGEQSPTHAVDNGTRAVTPPNPMSGGFRANDRDTQNARAPEAEGGRLSTRDRGPPDPRAAVVPPGRDRSRIGPRNSRAWCAPSHGPRSSSRSSSRSSASTRSARSTSSSSSGETSADRSVSGDGSDDSESS